LYTSQRPETAYNTPKTAKNTRKKHLDSANFRQADILNFDGNSISCQITSGGFPNLLKISLNHNRGEDFQYSGFDLEL